jgi:hypothetical protein
MPWPGAEQIGQGNKVAAGAAKIEFPPCSMVRDFLFRVLLHLRDARPASVSAHPALTPSCKLPNRR